MNNHQDITAKQLINSVLICSVLAIFVVVLFILPAEYGEDPTGFGEATGLNTLSGSAERPMVTKELDTSTGETTYQENKELLCRDEYQLSIYPA